MSEGRLAHLCTRCGVPVYNRGATCHDCRQVDPLWGKQFSVRKAARRGTLNTDTRTTRRTS